MDLGNATTASYNGSTVPYANSYRSDSCGGSGPDQVFTWTATFTGSLSLSMCTSSDLDGLIDVLDANQTELACSGAISMPQCPSGTGVSLVM